MREEETLQDSIMKELYYVNGSIYFNNEKFLKEEFDILKSISSSNFTNKLALKKYIAEGEKALKNNDITTLKEVIFDIRRLRIRTGEEEDEETGGGITITKG